MKKLLFLLFSLFSLSVFSSLRINNEEKIKVFEDYNFSGVSQKKTDLASNPAFTLATTQSSVDFTGGFPQNAVIEEATGTWCGYCPRGIVMCEYINEHYSDRIFPIAIHQDDKMEIEEYSDFFFKFVPSFPSAFVNRNEELDISTEGADQLYHQIKDQLTYAQVNVTAHIESNTLYIESDTEFAADMDSEHRLAFVVVEDGVGPYFQANYYNNTDAGLGMWDTAGSQVLWHFNDVARHIKSFDGIKKSLPEKIVAGEKYHYSTSMELTNVNSPSCKVIAMIIDSQSANIVNAAQCLVDSSEGIYINKGLLNMAIGDQENLIVYLNGLPLDENSCNWSSSDENVVIIDKYGHVEAVGPGSAVITVSCDAGSAQCQVYVSLVDSIFEIDGIRYKITGAITCMVAFPKEGERYMMEKIVIPAEIEVLGTAFEVTELEFSMQTFSGAFYKSPNLVEIELPNTISYIPGDTFEYCTKLKSFKVPSSVWFIDAYAFTGCTSLSNLELNEGLTGLWTWSCAWCDNLKNLVLPSTLEEMGREVLYGTHPYWIHSKAIVPPSLQGDLFNNEFLTEDYEECALIVPESSLNAYKESEFWNRFEMIVPDDVILCRYKLNMNPEDEFKLDVINSEGATVTWSCANPSIASVDSEGRVKAISTGETIVTAECKGKTASCKIIVTYNGEKVMVGDLWYEIKGKDTCAVIKNQSSDQPYNIEKVIIPSSIEYSGQQFEVTEISLGAFNGCTSMTDIFFANSIKLIDMDALSWCPNLSDIEFNEGLENIGWWAIANCSNLESIILPSTLKSIGLEAFAGDSPTLIVCKSSTPPEVDRDLFDNCSISSTYSECVLKVPANRVEAYKEAECWSRFANIEGDPSLVETVEVTGITVVPDEMSITEGETVTLTATVLPEDATDKTVIWSSGNETVAKVDANGMVTAISIGETTITARCGDVSAECLVKVVPTLVESLVITPDVWSGEEGSSFNISVAILPENATDKSLLWESSDSEIAKVDSEGNVNVIKEGTCVISVSTLDGSNLTALCLITSSAGIDQVFADPDMRFDVFNLKGIILKRNCSRDDLKLLTPGIYILRNEDKTATIFISNNP